MFASESFSKRLLSVIASISFIGKDGCSLIDSNTKVVNWKGIGRRRILVSSFNDFWPNWFTTPLYVIDLKLFIYVSILFNKIEKPISVKLVSSKCKLLRFGIKGIDFESALICSIESEIYVILSSCIRFVSMFRIGRASFVYLDISLQNWNLASSLADVLLTGYI